MGELVEISGNQILETGDWSNILTGGNYSPTRYRQASWPW